MKLWSIIMTMVACLVQFTLQAQEKKENCTDVVHLKNGSIFRGKISEYQLEGNLSMHTWSGTQIQIPASKIRRVVQKCKDEAPTTLVAPPEYSFKTTGWYHATRFNTYAGAGVMGLGVQHSSGLKLNRMLGIGVGVGFENFDPWDTDVATYPVFAEIRGYLLAKRITPFYALGAGYGISNRGTQTATFDGSTESWKGGWMAQGQIGYRLGNHALVHVGVRLQDKTRTWSIPWWGSTGKDRILHKRLEVGFGILL
jgi:hypothetical protein